MSNRDNRRAQINGVPGHWSLGTTYRYILCYLRPGTAYTNETEVPGVEVVPALGEVESRIDFSPSRPR